MNTEQDIRSEYLQDYRSMHNIFPGHALGWCSKWRDSSIEYFVKEGFPDHQNEHWKYTDLRALAQHHFPPPSDDYINEYKTCKALLDQCKFLTPDKTTLVFINGHYSKNLSIKPLNNTEAITLPLKEAFIFRPDLLEKHLGKNVTMTNGITMLNTAMMQQGACIHLKHGNLSKQDIQIVYINTGENEFIDHIRNIIILEEKVRANVLECYIGYSHARFVDTGLSEIYLHNRAQLEYNIIINNNPNSYHLGSSYVSLEADSHIKLNQIISSGRTVRRDILINHNAGGSHCELNGLSITQGKMLADTEVTVNHLKPGGSSQQYFKSVASDNSRCAFTGRIIVSEGAHHTKATQTSKNILLSDKAEADSRPQLEIYADDVQCSHGATIGQLDENAIMYLRSRSISETNARTMLIKAFLIDIQKNISPLNIQSWLNNHLDHYASKLPERIR